MVFDIALVLIILGFLVWGFLKGFAGILGSFLGLFAGVITAGHYYLWLSETLKFLPINSQLLKIISFFIILAGTTKLVIILLNLSFKFISIIPLVKTANRIIGAFLGSVIGILIVGSFIYLLSRYPFNLFCQNLILNSKTAPIILKFYYPITVLFPEIVRQLKSLI